MAVSRIHLGILTSIVVAPFLAASCFADPALYPTAPPDDAAFVRWLDEDDSYNAFGLDFAGAEDRTNFKFFSASESEEATPGGYYSFLTAANGDTVLIQEPTRGDQAKVHIVLVNATSVPARLIVPGQDTVVIDDIAVNSAGVRGVNPVKATLAVESADGSFEFGRVEVALMRGRNITIVARNKSLDMIEDGFEAGPAER